MKIGLVSDSYINDEQPKQNFVCPLLCVYIIISIASVCLAYKLVAIGQFILPAPPFIFPITYAIADIVAEVYGFKVARRFLWLMLGSEILFAFFVYFGIGLPSPDKWVYQDYYSYIFGKVPRFIMAGFLAVTISHYINIYMISKLKIIMKGKNFWLRSLLSSAVGGAVLVIITVLFGYVGQVQLKNIAIFTCSIYFVEFMYALVLAWPAWAMVCFLKLVEKSDYYDTDTDFKIFRY